MRITGIYKITNLSNQKFYIGQSRDIYTRWKAHTISLHDGCTESVIRMAFAKYSLREQVSKVGIYGNFNFEIIEICQDYNVQGIENLVNEPIDITDLDGFENFRMQCGNFAYGLQSMKNKPFYHDVIIPLIKNNKIQQPVSYNKWIDDFVERQEQLYKVKSAV